jgi:hypothetical protein
MTGKLHTNLIGSLVLPLDFADHAWPFPDKFKVDGESLAPAEIVAAWTELRELMVTLRSVVDHSLSRPQYVQHLRTVPKGEGVTPTVFIKKVRTEPPDADDTEEDHEDM